MVRTFQHALPIEGYLLKTIDGHELLNRATSNQFLVSLGDLYTSSTLTPVTVADGLVVTQNQLAIFLTQLEEYLNSLGRLYCVSGNVASGHISVLTLFDPRSRNYDDDLITYPKNIFALVKDYDGGISAQGGEGLSRTPYIHYVYNDATLSVFKKIKDAWDPLNILNPGKKLGATTTYLQQHLTRPRITE
jgi:FAD/FMN-containing dehydrogenase